MPRYFKKHDFINEIKAIIENKKLRGKCHHEVATLKTTGYINSIIFADITTVCVFDTYQYKKAKL